MSEHLASEICMKTILDGCKVCLSHAVAYVYHVTYRDTHRAFFLLRCPRFLLSSRLFDKYYILPCVLVDNDEQCIGVRLILISVYIS